MSEYNKNQLSYNLPNYILLKVRLMKMMKMLDHAVQRDE